MSPVDVSASLVYANNTNAGAATANASWSGDANHTGNSGSGGFTINKASSTTAVTIIGGPFTYTGAAITPASVAVTGAGGLNLMPYANYANNTDAGAATASYSFGGDGNHLPSSDSKNFPIGKATSTTTVTVSSAVWDGNPHGGTATVIGALLNQPVTPVVYSGAQATVYGPSSTAPSGPGNYQAQAMFAGDSNHLISSDSKTFSIGSWTENGFFAPVDMTTGATIIWNTVKGGSTVPLKFEIFAGQTEQTNVSAVDSVSAFQMNCSSGVESTVDDFTNTGGSSLRYDSTSGFFIQNWQTPKKANSCYVVVMTAKDGSKIDKAYFKLK